jgi:hypothetical protein
VRQSLYIQHSLSSISVRTQYSHFTPIISSTTDPLTTTHSEALQITSASKNWPKLPYKPLTQTQAQTQPPPTKQSQYMKQRRPFTQSLSFTEPQYLTELQSLTESQPPTLVTISFKTAITTFFAQNRHLSHLATISHGASNFQAHTLSLSRIPS